MLGFIRVVLTFERNVRLSGVNSVALTCLFRNINFFCLVPKCGPAKATSVKQSTAFLCYATLYLLLYFIIKYVELIATFYPLVFIILTTCVYN